MTPVLLIAALAAQMECALTLEARGFGSRAATLAQPYAECLNATMGTQTEMLRQCSAVRDAQVDASGKTLRGEGRAKFVRAMNWLDAMADERANCGTRLRVSK